MFDTALQIAGLLIGLIYLYYEYHASPKVWIAGLVMPMVSMFVYYRKGLYADFGMNVYYLLMAIYGYLAWTGRINLRKLCGKSGKGATATSTATATSGDASAEAPLKIRHLEVGKYAGVLVVSALIWWGIAMFLIHATDSTVPWADAFTTAMSIVGTWMLARKYLEQWIVWILVDAVCVALYIYKGIYPYALLYAIYTIIAVFGYRKWLRLMHAPRNAYNS